MDFPRYPINKIKNNGIPTITVPKNLMVIVKLIVHNRYIMGKTTIAISPKRNQGIFECLTKL